MLECQPWEFQSCRGNLLNSHPLWGVFGMVLTYVVDNPLKFSHRSLFSPPSWPHVWWSVLCYCLWRIWQSLVKICQYHLQMIFSIVLKFLCWHVWLGAGIPLPSLFPHKLFPVYTRVECFFCRLHFYCRLKDVYASFFCQRCHVVLLWFLCF